MSAPTTVFAEPQAFERIVEALPDAVFVYADHALVYANRRFCDLVQRDRSYLETTALHDLFAPDARQPTLDFLERATGGESASVECRFARPSGPVLDAELRAMPIPLAGRTAVACIVRDLSDRNAIQARLMLSDRMASVGTLAAGVAHEINNPLAFVIINLAFISEQLERLPGAAPPDVLRELQIGEILEAIGEAQEGSQRVRRIVHDLRTFARADEEKREPVKLGQLLETCISMAWNEIRHRAQLERAIEAVPPIDANSARLAHAFLNVIVNAAQAIPPGNAENNRIRIGLRKVSAEALQITVSDTGHGIPPSVLPRIFDPFFTTKPVGVGTGLGLSVVHGTITAMGGRISVHSTPGQGTTFTIDLPLRAASEDRDVVPKASVSPQRRGRVLVIDDEESVGTSLRRGLRSHHDVEYVITAAGALAALSSAQAPYDVILCDLMMPDVSGIELYAEIERRFPDAKDRLVFFTGGAFVPEAQAFLDRIPNHRIEKPLDLNHIKNLIHDIVDGEVTRQ